MGIGRNLPTRYWTGDCNSPAHIVSVSWDDDGSGWLSLHDSTNLIYYDGWSLRSWWMRLKAAWGVFFFGHCEWAEITLDPQTRMEIAGELLKGPPVPSTLTEAALLGGATATTGAAGTTIEGHT